MSQDRAEPATPAHQERTNGAPLRVALFTHDTFGLGHVRRCRHIVDALARAVPDAAILMVSGSPALHAFGQLPRNADVVKIPTIARTGRPQSRPPHLPIDVREITSLREGLIYGSVVPFRPDVFLVDNFPLGSRKELLPTLGELRRRGTRSILGLRDILDRPDVVRRNWSRDGVYEALETCYDQILVYGLPDVLDVAAAYELPDGVADRVSYCGYVTNAAVRKSADVVRGELGVPGPFVLVTVGGGGDGLPLIEAVLEAMKGLHGVTAVIVLGPLMGAEDRARIHAGAGGDPGLILRDFVADLPSVMGAADLVIAMGGYNTTAEIMAVRCPSLIVPRTWRYGDHAEKERSGEEWEQLLRAEAMARNDFAEVLHPEDLSPEALRRHVTMALSGSRTGERTAIALNGARRATEHIIAQAGKRRCGHGR